MKRTMYVFSVLLILLLTACGGNKNEDQGETGANKVEQVLRFNLDADPPSIDPQLNTDVSGAMVINNTFEGLMRNNASGKPEPAMAESVEVSEDKTVYIFHLRKDAKWSDGRSVTAEDFKYAWLRGLDPEVASEYAYQLYYIKGGQDYFKGKGKREDVGLEVLDDYTLRVELEAPTPYFLNLVTFFTYMPVRKDIVDQKPEGWAKDPGLTVSNGPFVVSKYKINDKIILTPNENYWNREDIKLKKMVLTMIIEGSTVLTAYDNDEIDVISGQVPVQEIPKRQMEDSTFKTLPYLGTYYYLFNVDREPTNDINVRKALSLAIDREAIVNQITKAGQMPATGFVPNGLIDSKGNDFRATAGDYDMSTTANIELARKYLAKAGYANGQGMPPVELMYNTSESHKAIAEAIQSMWKKNLGIEVTLANQEWAVFKTTRSMGNFQVMRSVWLGDYNDPMTFLDMWTSYSGNNNAQWRATKDGKFPENKKFTGLIEESKLVSGEARDEKLYAAEKIMMDQAIIAPLYYYTGVVMIKDKVKNWERDILGTWYFGNAEIMEK
ncbi:peptide ABC transporter substrate-binding protein [Psychrilyobacter atlanticus]|uniref:peptide ABC transporter substrate-binding protein n=1 Tax=Psychrilyobacter atlanticus TaxID=271091 RepID=UPI000416B7E6|nr:peptide ABC transporter substrate-binding protein [Psychrilyobacter atlanticus]